MNFKLRKYMGPNFNEEKFLNAPNVLYEEVKTEGVAPDNYHAMSIYPEYFKIDGKWILAKEIRMDGVVVIIILKYLLLLQIVFGKFFLYILLIHKLII